MFTSKNLLALAVIAASATSAALADDTSTTTPAPVKKESALKKDAEAPLKGTEKGVKAVGRDTEKGAKAVGRGTEKVIMAPAHEMGKLMHHGKKAPKAGTNAATDATTSTPAQ
jgi:hypothetical protein